MNNIQPFEVWSVNYIKEMTDYDLSTGAFLVRTRESILSDLEYTFGSRELAEAELEAILREEYKLYVERMEFGLNG